VYPLRKQFSSFIQTVEPLLANEGKTMSRVLAIDMLLQKINKHSKLGLSSP
jgi:hypothetical protein